MSKVLTGLAAAFGLIATAALAQNPTPPDRVRPQADSAPTDTSLSDRLKQSDGVIKPPADAAPGMVVAPPDPSAGTMPVIKPGDLPGRKPGTEAR